MRYFSKKLYWVMQLSGWFIATIFLRLPTTKYFNDPQLLYSYVISSFLICIICTHTYAALFVNKTRNNKQTILFAFLGISITGGAIFFLDYYFGFQRYRKPSEGIPLANYDYIQFFIESIRYVGLWFLIYHLLVSNFETQKRVLALSQSETALKTAELANLKNQLNPHFLFNAINSIKALTLSEPHLARSALTELSQLLRASLSMGNEQLITFETEVSFVRDYLSLEKLRYENRLNYFFEIDKNSLNTKIPPMSLQLLVENAIKHGIATSKEGGHIRIKSTYIENVFLLSVINSGKLKQNHTFGSTGVGLKNLEKRLFLSFQNDAVFKVNEKDNHVIASISIVNDGSILYS